MRDVGKMGEKVLELWTGQVGIVCNKAGEDKGGWDYLLQLPAVIPASTQVLSLDRLPPSSSCLVQVKASDALDTPDVKLDNWRRLADPALPAFFLLLNFAAGDGPVDAALVHLRGGQTGRAPQKLPETSRDE